MTSPQAEWEVRSAWRTAWQGVSRRILPERLRQNRAALIGLVITTVFVFIALFGPLLAPQDPTKVAARQRLQPPSREHLLGTDEIGRDILSRLLAGAPLTLGLSLTAVAASLAVGTVMGVVAGYFGGKRDLAISFTVNVLMALPGFLLALAMVAILGVGLVNIVVAVAVYMAPHFARVARGSALTVRELEYVTAARSLGASDLRIMVRHVLPNIAAPLIVLITLRMALAILTISGLSFLGLGAQPPSPEWGAMIATARNFLFAGPHVVLFPGLAIMLVVYGFNMLGDGLRDTLDPRLRGTT